MFLLLYPGAEYKDVKRTNPVTSNVWLKGKMSEVVQAWVAQSPFRIPATVMNICHYLDGIDSTITLLKTSVLELCSLL